jgi:hypothetical protein
MPIIIEGAGLASNKTISSVSINFYKSLGTKFGIENSTNECFRSNVTSLVTGWEKLNFQKGFFNDEATIYIEQEKPLPLTILAIEPSVMITER